MNGIIFDWHYLLGEFIGTFVLVLLGNGVCAVNNYKKMYGKSGGWLMIAVGWALAVLFGALIADACGAPGHLNPVVTITALLAIGMFAHLHAVLYFLMIAMQFAGAIFAQVVLNFLNWHHIKENDFSALKGSSCTGPTHRNAWVRNFSYEFIGTLLLLIVIFVVNVNNKLPYISISIVAIGLSLGAVTGYAINPARDLGPRLVYYAMTKLPAFRSSLIDEETKKIKAEYSADLKYGFLIPTLAPMTAAIVVGSGLLIKTLMSTM
ncbi:aquaporin family protein [Mycoplasmopsis caviae]|uniref:Aquaglyceroporin n=1 Tax=Mycoplasmopsis caviae TaxID=55603 RepID=A0A3P8KMB1_9BACT|nr:MIP/aquaporin family protein [Mycoplasmopsis caviae]UUD35295.1 aquaporin family protein [Mycoplasmopsis caviae]VDR41928.1 Aquaglyceroporin [Mycoplasmopsis caviae]